MKSLNAGPGNHHSKAAAVGAYPQTLSAASGRQLCEEIGAGRVGVRERADAGSTLIDPRSLRLRACQRSCSASRSEELCFHHGNHDGGHELVAPDAVPPRRR